MTSVRQSIIFRRNFVIVLALAIGLGVASRPSIAAADPDPIVYLTWQRDPTTTMTVQWLAEGDTACEARARCRTADGPWRVSNTPSCRPMPGRETVTVHHAEFTELLPGTTYELRIGTGERTWKFATLSADETTPLRFVVGGDMNIDFPDELARVQRATAQHAPDFAVIGGDIAYAHGLVGNVRKWVTLLSTWDDTMVTPAGLSIPLLVTPGNHEVANGGYSQNKADAPFFYALFAFPAPAGYGVIDIGKRASIILLDSGHSNPVEGEQTEWLKRTLEARKEVTFKIPVYHRPAYPCVRLYYRKKTRVLRKYWTPLFDAYGVDFAFEHHDHTYKRSQPIRDKRVDPDGIVYLGDGGWGGMRARKPAPVGRGGIFSNRRWYLARTEQTSHYMLVTLDGLEAHVQAFDTAEHMFDEWRMRKGEPHEITATYTRPYLLRPETWLVILAVVLPVLYRRRGRRRAASEDQSVAD